ncbi:MAG TPA: hypothetical protein VKR83_20135 [Ktedonobacteraceae bacterium]|nr:hypothetical protein [Ktedonobacteraceae bacterium]
MGALVRRGRIASKDRVAEVSTGTVVGQGDFGQEPGQGCTTQDASDAPEGLAARVWGRQGFGERFKLPGIHLRSLLSQ